MSNSGRHNSKISNQPTGGGSKLQGLAPRATNFYIANNTGNVYNTQTHSEDRHKIFIQNMLGGIGRMRSQFASNADGIIPSPSEVVSNLIYTYSVEDLSGLSASFSAIMGPTVAPKYSINVYKYSVPVIITDDSNHSIIYDNTSIMYVYKLVDKDTSNNLLVLHGADNAYGIDPQSNFTDIMGPSNHATLALIASATGHTVRFPLYPGFGVHDNTGHFDTDEPWDWFPKTMALDDFSGENLSIYAYSMGGSVANLLVKYDLLSNYTIKSLYLGAPAVTRSLLYDASWGGLEGYPVLTATPVPVSIDPYGNLNFTNWSTTYSAAPTTFYSTIRLSAGISAEQVEDLDGHFNNFYSTYYAPLPLYTYQLLIMIYAGMLALTPGDYTTAFVTTLAQIQLGIKFGVDSWYNMLTEKANKIFKTSQSATDTITGFVNLYKYNNIAGTQGTGDPYIAPPNVDASNIDISGLARILGNSPCSYGYMLEAMELSMNQLPSDTSINIFYDVSDSITPFLENRLFDISSATDLSNNITKYFLDEGFAHVQDDATLYYANAASAAMVLQGYPPLGAHAKGAIEPIFHFMINNAI